MPSTVTKPASLTARWIAIATPVEAVLPLMQGAMHFGPSALVNSDTSVHDWTEPLNERGEAFMRIVREYLADALRESIVAEVDLPGMDHLGEFRDRAGKVLQLMQRSLLIAHALLAPDFPENASAHDGMNEILQNVEKAAKLCGQMETTAYEAEPAGGKRNAVWEWECALNLAIETGQEPRGLEVHA